MVHPVTFRHWILTAAAVLGMWRGEKAGAVVISNIDLVNGTDPAKPLLLSDAAVLQSSLRDFRGRPDNEAVREAIADAVLKHYQSAGWPVVDVSVAHASRGSVNVQIQEGRFGEISVRGGSEWMRSATYSDWSRRKGEPLRSEDLASELAWLHRNPMHAGTISFAPGTETATADATLTLQENRPVRPYAGWRNDGSPPLDRDRFFAGVEMADVGGLSSWLNLEAIAGADVNEFYGGSGMLRLFLPVHHEVRLSGYWTHAESTTALPGFDSVSDLEAWNVSLRWLMPLPAWRGWHSDFGIGADFFRLDSVVSAGTAGVAGRADTLHLAAGFQAVRRSGAWQSGFEAGVAVSPGGVTDADNDASYGALRYGAKSEYTLVRAAAWSQRDLSGGWTATGRVSGQWASDPVLPTQEFSPAGSNGVRGYPSSSALGDNGIQGGVEFLTPLLALPAALSRLRMRAAAFVDAGHVHDLVTGDGEGLASAGAGLRVRWRECAGLALDYGWRLTEPGGRLHLSMRMEF
jgi:hemolysin activation/secretion protein